MGFRTNFIWYHDLKISRKFKKKYKKLFDYNKYKIISKFAFKIYDYPNLLDDVRFELNNNENEYNTSILLIYECGCMLRLLFHCQDIEIVSFMPYKNYLTIPHYCVGGCDGKETIEKRYDEIYKEKHKNETDCLWKIIYDYEKKYVELRRKKSGNGGK